MHESLVTFDFKAKKKFALLAAVLLCFGLAACDSDDGPMEKAGKSVDQATTDVGNKIEDKCEQAKDSVGMKDTDC